MEFVVIPEAASAAWTGVWKIREKTVPRVRSPTNKFFIFINFTPVKNVYLKFYKTYHIPFYTVIQYFCKGCFTDTHVQPCKTQDRMIK